ncbi:MAG: hypothetical protein GZ089_02965 [Aromatoleum sp.]|nr:hypothetical protein [Aromatoleum sp.]
MSHEDPAAGGVTGAPRDSVVAALRRVLRPLVRLLVTHGITYPFLTDLLKGIFVATAAEEFTLGGKPPTDSRLTVLTGVHRKDIRRLLRDVPSVPGPSPSLTLGTQIVARWLGDPAYHDRYGRPRVLPRTPSRGAASFAALVESVSKNVRPRSVLDELVRLGVAEIDGDDRVHLVTRGFVPGKELDAKAFYFGEALHDHLAAGVHNLDGSQPAWLERSVYYDELSPASVDKLAARSEEVAMRALQEINRDGMALEAADPPSAGQRMRMRLGVFFYAEPVASAPPVGDAGPPMKPRRGK